MIARRRMRAAGRQADPDLSIRSAGWRNSPEHHRECADIRSVSVDGANDAEDVQQDLDAVSEQS